MTTALAAPADVDYTAIFRGAHAAVIDATNQIIAVDQPMTPDTVSALRLASFYLRELSEFAAAGTLHQMGAP